MTTPSAPHSPCIDAETLAAWSERSLSAEDAAEVELHLSDCVRCQSVLAAFGRTLEDQQEEHREGRRLNGRWLVPLAAAAAILIWIAIPKREPAQAPASVAARNEAPEVLAEERVGTPAPPAAAQQEKRASGQLGQASAADKANAEENAKVESATKADSRQREAANAAPASSPTVSNLPRSAADRSSAPAGQARRSSEVAPASPVRGAVLMDGISPAPVSPPPPSPPSPAPAPPASLTRSAGNAVADAAKAVPQTEAVQSAAASPESANEPVFNTLTSSLAKQVALEIVSADPGAATGQPAQGTTVGGIAGGAGGRGGGGGGGRGGAGAAAGRGGPVGFAPTPTRWHILGPGTAERSTDGGRSWDPITIDPPVTITSGSSPSPAVCWLIGPRGVVLLSVDGLHFERRPFPDTTDLSSVRATDAAHASITTSAGRVFETSDGGRSWQARD